MGTAASSIHATAARANAHFPALLPALPPVPAQAIQRDASAAMEAEHVSHPWFFEGFFLDTPLLIFIFRQEAEEKDELIWLKSSVAFKGQRASGSGGDDAGAGLL